MKFKPAIAFKAVNNGKTINFLGLKTCCLEKINLNNFQVFSLLNCEVKTQLGKTSEKNDFKCVFKVNKATLKI